MSRSEDAWRVEFERIAADKAASAAKARLFPYVTAAANPDKFMLPVGNRWTSALFDGAFYVSPARDTQRPACSLVFVQSADGNTGASDPASLGGGDTDTHLVYEGLSRVAADAVLAGAETIRGGQLVFSVWHPELEALRASLGLPRHPVPIVATLRGVPIEDLLLFNVPALRVVLLTLESAVPGMQPALDARPWVTPLLMRSPADLPRAFGQLRAMGIVRVSCVGGRTLARQLLEARLVDEVYLTTGPRSGGEPGTPISPAPWRGRTVLRKHGTETERGVLFEHVLPA